MGTTKTSKKNAPGKASGKEGPSAQAPARQAPSAQAPARQAPARQGPSAQGPARQAPARQGPGAQAPARRPSGARTPARQTSGGAAGYEPPVYSPAAGKRALESLGAELGNVAESEIGNQRIDVEVATYVALGVAGFVSAPAVKVRFARLPEEEFDPRVVPGLTTACFATLYAIGEARAAAAAETDARIPPGIAAEAAEVEARMQTLCEYHFKDDPEIAPELARLRPGHGHRDLANDLLGYARIYELRAAVVKTDPKHYRSTDAARARELAGLLIQALSAALTPRVRAARDTYLRTWTLLRRHYAEVRAAGLWLFRADPARQDRFPSLFAAARPTAGRPKKAPPGAAPGSGVAPTGGEKGSGGEDGSGAEEGSGREEGSGEAGESGGGAPE